jgi:hypothetical protein
MVLVVIDYQTNSYALQTVKYFLHVLMP